jgi:hypothetical protein
VDEVQDLAGYDLEIYKIVRPPLKLPWSGIRVRQLTAPSISKKMRSTKKRRS